LQSHNHIFKKSDKKCDCKISLLKRAKMWDERMCDCPTTCWAIAHFENVRSLFLKSNSEIRTLFAHSLILKERLCDRSFCRCFEKCDKKCNTQLHFWKEWQKVWLHNRTFEKSDKKCDHTIALLKRAKMCECAIAQPLILQSLIVFSSSNFIFAMFCKADLLPGLPESDGLDPAVRHVGGLVPPHHGHQGRGHRPTADQASWALGVRIRMDNYIRIFVRFFLLQIKFFYVHYLLKLNTYLTEQFCFQLDFKRRFMHSIPWLHG